jgi:hypothetical protein
MGRILADDAAHQVWFVLIDSYFRRLLSVARLYVVPFTPRLGPALCLPAVREVHSQTCERSTGDPNPEPLCGVKPTRNTKEHDPFNDPEPNRLSFP